MVGTQGENCGKQVIEICVTVADEHRARYLNATTSYTYAWLRAPDSWDWVWLETATRNRD